jgi:hypothetical protein
MYTLQTDIPTESSCPIKQHFKLLLNYKISLKVAIGQPCFKVENEFGEETALIDVVVRSEPGKPRGPLKIDEVHATGCTARWAAPDDDGGSPVTHYVVEKMASNCGSWQPCGKADDTEFRVTGLTVEKEYRIQVHKRMFVFLVCFHACIL